VLAPRPHRWRLRGSQEFWHGAQDGALTIRILQAYGSRTLRKASCVSRRTSARRERAVEIDRWIGVPDALTTRIGRSSGSFQCGIFTDGMGR
jgi:hypothetical protein